MEEKVDGTSSVQKIVSNIERQISNSDISEDLSTKKNKMEAKEDKAKLKMKKENNPKSEDLSTKKNKREAKEHKAKLKMKKENNPKRNDKDEIQIDQETAQQSSKSKLVQGKTIFSELSKNPDIEEYQGTTIEGKVDVEIEKESILIKNDSDDIQVDQQTAEPSSKLNPRIEKNSSSNFSEDLNAEENQTKTTIFHANTEIENVAVITKKDQKDSNENQVDQQKAQSPSKSNPNQEEDSSSDLSKNLNIKEDKVKAMEYKADVNIEKENIVIKHDYNDIQVNQQTAQAPLKLHLVIEKNIDSDKNETDSTTCNEASKVHDNIDSGRIASLDDKCETREQQENSKIKYQELLKLNQKITNNNKIWYILLAVVLGIFLYHHISTESDNKQLKMQLDRAHMSIEDLNKKIRSLEDENKILHDKLYDALAKTSNNTFNSEIISITNERDTLEIKLQEALNQIKLLQTKLDHALSENNYLQAHAKEGNMLMNKESSYKSKAEDDSFEWLFSTIQSIMGYIFNLPIYILFSFQITFLNLTCSVLLRDKLCSKLLKTPAIKLRYANPSKFINLHFFSCILGYPIACELVGLVGWFTGFSVSKSNMFNLPKPIGLMVRSGEDIMSDWITQDNALIIWLVSIIAGGIITFIQYMWYAELDKRLKTAQLTKHQILLTLICTLIFLNLSLYRIFSWVTWNFIGVTIGPITFVNWLGARKAVSKILSVIIYSILPLFTLSFLYKKSPNLLRNIFIIFKNQLFKSK